MKNHYSIAPIDAFVLDSLLYSDEMYASRTECKIIALNLYQNEALSFDILLNDGSLFCYVPIDKLFTRKESFQDYDLKDLVYHNVNDGFKISIQQLDYLKGKPSYCYLKFKDSWVPITEYFFTIDWYEGNDLLHFIALKSGNFALMPSHKIKFDSDDLNFQPYQKLRETWVV